MSIEFTGMTTTSTDGTRIEYLVGGTGPGLVLVPGALTLASDFLGLARLLAVSHNVAIVQRRGRGGSGPQGPDYSLERECEDLAAVWAASGARFLFGHSFGGLIALRFARSRADVAGLAVYEPGVSEHGSIPTDWLPRATGELERGDALEAFLTFAQGVNPQPSGNMPREQFRQLVTKMIPAAKLRQNLTLIGACLREHIEVGRLDGSLADYAAISAPTLVLRGTNGARNDALGALAQTVPFAESISLAGLDHFGPEHAPDIVAARLREFFAPYAGN
jgi:pimeloyl-ACP methyl ester carboxylesterase